MQPIVCINAFTTDSTDEVDAITEAARAWNVPAAVSQAYVLGGNGARELAQLVRRADQEPTPSGSVGLYAPEVRLDEKLLELDAAGAVRGL